MHLRSRHNQLEFRKNSCFYQNSLENIDGRKTAEKKNVQIAVMNYNTTYHETLGCKPSTVFPGQITYNVLDLKLGIRSKWKTTPNSHIADQLQKQIDEVRATAKDNIMLSHLKYKKCFDRKASAVPLKLDDYCYIFNPKADNQSTKFAYQDCICMGLYVVINVLSYNNYLIRKIRTRYTQTLHRIRIRQYAPQPTSQCEQINIFHIRTSECRTTNGIQLLGKWTSKNQ